jgi:hypothetical protein
MPEWQEDNNGKLRVMSKDENREVDCDVQYLEYTKLTWYMLYSKYPPTSHLPSYVFLLDFRQEWQ